MTIERKPAKQKKCRVATCRASFVPSRMGQAVCSSPCHRTDGEYRRPAHCWPAQYWRTALLRDKAGARDLTTRRSTDSRRRGLGGGGARPNALVACDSGGC